MRYVALIALLPLAACSQSARSGEPTADDSNGSTRSFALEGFNAVDAAGPDNVDVRVGSGFSIRAEGSAKVLDRLEITREGDTLKVTRKSDSGFHWGTDRGARVYITMPRITAASATGSGEMTIDHVEGGSFTAHATGSGNLAVGRLDVQNADFSVTGSGDIKAAGTAHSASFSVQGSGDIDAATLKSSIANVSVTGSGDVEASVYGPAAVDVVGSGDVKLTGGAKCTISKAGSGDVDCS